MSETPKTEAAYKGYQGLVRAAIAAGNLLETSRAFELALKDIAEIPEYDQDDAHRLRNKARVALGLTKEQS
jgi:hypothetical protein